MNKSKIVSIEEICSGDVLLCYNVSKKTDFIGRGITQVTKSEYTHAAICIDSLNAAESNLFQGVRIVSVKKLVNKCDHVAVFRQPDAWSQHEVVLKHFDVL
ncbi:MAG: hypothetical protein HGA59_06685 [Chlorobiaceae bacterium]|jgi:hypothetical protein|nr:hypothetical protein [Chlorobiaceae bacterium]